MLGMMWQEYRLCRLTDAGPDTREALFPYIQEVAVSEYKILDNNNKEIIKTKVFAEEGDKGTVCAGKVFVNLSLNDVKLKSGEGIHNRN